MGATTAYEGLRDLRVGPPLAGRGDVGRSREDDRTFQVFVSACTEWASQETHRAEAGTPVNASHAELTNGHTQGDDPSGRCSKYPGAGGG